MILKKNLYKLMNNAIFGKTMENVQNHVNVKLLTKWKGQYGAIEFVELRTRMYALRVDGKKDTKKRKM